MLPERRGCTPESQARRIQTQRRNARAQHGWIAARLNVLGNGVGNSGFARLRRFDPKGNKVHPHARHWQRLAELVGVQPENWSHQLADTWLTNTRALSLIRDADKPSKCIQCSMIVASDEFVEP